MSGVKLPVTRPAGHALLIGNESCRAESLQLLQRLGFECDFALDPYTAVVELSRQPRTFNAVVVSLNSFYREELQFIAAVKQMFAGVEVWLTLTDGRAAALAEAMRLGADGLVNEEGWHRTAATGDVSQNGRSNLVSPISAPRRSPTSFTLSAESRGVTEPHASTQHNEFFLNDSTGEPLLSPEELRALLQEPPAVVEPDAVP